MWTEKKIRVEIQLVKGTFISGFNTKVIEGLPIDLEIGKSGLPAMDSATLKIYGINQYDLESLTFLSFKTLEINRNLIQVYAGDDSKMSLVYSGEITGAYPEYNSAPDVFLKIEAISGYYPSAVIEPPYSVKGNIQIATAINALAKKIGYTFKNDGVVGILNNPYYKGSVLSQIIAIAEDSQIDLTITGQEIRIRPSTGIRKVMAVLNKDSGLLGFPSYTQNGVRLKAEFIPDVSLGDWISLESIVPKSTGTWQIFSIKHKLQSYLKDGSWFTELECSPTGVL